MSVHSQGIFQLPLAHFAAIGRLAFHSITSSALDEQRACDDEAQRIRGIANL